MNNSCDLCNRPRSEYDEPWFRNLHTGLPLVCPECHIVLSQEKTDGQKEEAKEA